MTKGPDIFVTLSTFALESDEPRHLLEASGFTFGLNLSGKRVEPQAVIDAGQDSLGLIAGVENYSADTLAKLPNLRCISRCGVGIDNIDLSAAKAQGIAVLNTPDEPPIAVAEMTLAMILALLRQLPKVNQLTHEGRWQRVTGNLLSGKVVGIIGLGRIGRRVARLLQAFGAVVIAVDPHPDERWVLEHNIEILDLAALLRASDIVSIHSAHSKEYPLRLGVRELTSMKDGAWLVNMGRGDTVDEMALCDALSSGKLSGAALDVFEREPYDGCLLKNERVIVSPHQATLTFETRAAMETKAVNNLINYLRGESGA